MNLDSIYLTRFPEADREAKAAIWRVLCENTQFAVPRDSASDEG